MGRIKPTTKKKLLKAIELLHEVELEVREAKPFFGSICRSVADALQASMEDHRYRQFSFDVPRGKFHQFRLSPFDNETPEHRRLATLVVTDC